LTVTVEDDSPAGTDISDNLNASGSLVTTNLVLVIDTSGSIAAIQRHRLVVGLKMMFKEL